MDTKTPHILQTMVLQTQSGLRFDKTKNGYALVENVSLGYDPTLTLVLDTFFLKGERSIVGQIMIDRARADDKEKGTRAGQFHAERMLEQQENIPTDWRKQKFYPLFTGTIWRNLDGVMKNHDGDLFVPFLQLQDEGWHLNWISLFHNFNHDFYIVRVGK